MQEIEKERVAYEKFRGSFYANLFNQFYGTNKMQIFNILERKAKNEKMVFLN
jgi:hypothetical protein